MRMVLVAFFLLGLVGCSNQKHIRTDARTGDDWRMENKSNRPSPEHFRTICPF